MGRGRVSRRGRVPQDQKPRRNIRTHTCVFCKRIKEQNRFPVKGRQGDGEEHTPKLCNHCRSKLPKDKVKALTAMVKREERYQDAYNNYYPWHHW